MINRLAWHFQVALQSEMKYRIVDKVLIDPDFAINRDLHFDPSGTYFYSMTKNKVRKVFCITLFFTESYVKYELCTDKLVFV